MKRSQLVAAIGVPITVLFLVSCMTNRSHLSSAPREWFREGAGRTVVMLGGGVDGAAIFAPHAQTLSSRYDVIRIQTLNVQNARSGAPMPSDYSVATEVEALHQTLSHLKVTSPVDMVGSSYGAVVALHFTVKYPEYVKTLTLFEPPAFWILPPEEFRRDTVLREMQELTSAMTAGVTPSDEQLYRFRCLLGSCPPGIPSLTDSTRAEWDISRAAMRGLSAVPDHREDRREIERLPHPVLLVRGSESVDFHRRINELLAREIPKCETGELPGTHSAVRTAKIEFIELLRAFLERHQ